MLINQNEYRQMYETEEKLWWYRILHEKVLRQIFFNFKNSDIKILDAGCGTGGMISKLKKNGFENIFGFDFSEDAVFFCNQRDLNVKKNNILFFADDFQENSFDLIICNDVLYQFDDHEFLKIISNFEKILKPNGFLISNNQAFKIFYGTHDIAVGAKQRFRKKDFDKYFEKSNFRMQYSTYWSFFLSPLILIVRLIQRIKLKLNLIDLKKIKSDVELPSDFINFLFYKIVKFEEKLSSKFPFGSSLFLVIKNKKPNS